MSTLRQLQANRLNALKSTGPRTEEGKQQARLNAVRHGLTAETVIGCLEDAEDYKAFEEAVCDGYAPFTAVERELVLRLASVLWRLRRANLIETELFRAESLKPASAAIPPDGRSPKMHPLAAVFVRLIGQPNKPIERLTRYEGALWRQAKQVMAQLHLPARRRAIRSSPFI